MELFVPGRICLFGEHSDWAGGYRRVDPRIEKGYTLVSGTDQGIHARIAPHPDALILTSTAPDGAVLGPHELPLNAEKLREVAKAGGFWSYMAGVAYQAVVHHAVGGLVFENYHTSLPVKKGLSSSAAICVLMARAFNRLYQLNLTVRGEMELAYQGEITTPSRCGRMDQACAFGRQPVLMAFDGDDLVTSNLSPARDIYLVIVDLLSEKNTVEILARLNACYPQATDELGRGVQELLGPINKRLVHEAASALEAGDAQRLGALMNEAQDAFDRLAAPACPEELTAPKLHEVLAHPSLAPYIWGGKGVGSQGDGAAQLVARSAEDQQTVIDILASELGLPGVRLTLQANHAADLSPIRLPDPAPAARASRVKVRKAVIPAAGFGTRLFPATKATKKELFPIVDSQGVARPAVQLIIEEALESGLEEIVLIVQQEDLEGFRSYFEQPLSQENFNRLPAEARDRAALLEAIGERISFVVQPSQEGFGHAVHCARHAVGDQPFLLMLGDHLYRSHTPQRCANQLLEAAAANGGSVIGLHITEEARVSHYGAAAGRWREPGRVLDLSRLVEKPPIPYAREHLQVEGLPPGHYLTMFGMYILQPRIFDVLGDHITRDVRERGEIQLTAALERLRQEQGMLGVLIQGEQFDIGRPDHYLETLQAFRGQ